jgi:plastocyanin
MFHVLHRYAPRVVLLGAVGAGVVLLAACSENNGDTVPPTEAAAQGTGTLTIEARDFSFVPELAAATLGDPVKIDFKNRGSAKHSLSFFEDAANDEPLPRAATEVLDAGAESSLEFEAPAQATTLYFRCEVHPDRMKGELKVGSA